MASREDLNLLRAAAEFSTQHRGLRTVFVDSLPWKSLLESGTWERLQKSGELGSDLGGGNTALHLAVQRGNSAFVHQLLKTDSKLVGIKNKHGETPLHVAVGYDMLEIVELLIKRGGQALFHAKNRDGDTALHKALKDGNVPAARALLKAADGELLSSKDSSGNTALLIAVEKEKIDIVEALLEKDGDLIKATNEQGSNALHLAVTYGYTHLSKFLLEKDLSLINGIDKAGRTVLHLAAKHGYLEIAKFLLTKNPQLIDLRDYNCNGAVHLATEHGHFSLLRTLLKNSSKLIRTTNDNDDTVVHLAAKHSQVRIIKFVLKRNTKLIDAVNKDGNTAFHLAAAGGAANILKILMRKDNKLIHATNRHGSTAAHLAARHGRFHALAFLLKKDSTLIETINHHGDTLLHLAAKNGNLDIVQLLLAKSSALINAINESGDTALLLAVKQGNTSILKVLLETENKVINTINKASETALLLAAYKDNCFSSHGESCNAVATVKLLESHGAVDQEDTKRSLRALLAAIQNNGELLRALVEKYGLSVLDATTETYHFTPLHLAAKLGWDDIVKLYIERGRTLEKPDLFMGVPLRHAIINGHLYAVALLVEGGANIKSVYDNQGRAETALFIATRSRKTSIVRYLLTQPMDISTIVAARTLAENFSCPEMTKLLRGREEEITHSLPTGPNHISDPLSQQLTPTENAHSIEKSSIRRRHAKRHTLDRYPLLPSPRSSGSGRAGSFFSYGVNIMRTMMGGLSSFDWQGNLMLLLLFFGKPGENSQGNREQFTKINGSQPWDLIPAEAANEAEKVLKYLERTAKECNIAADSLDFNQYEFYKQLNGSRPKTPSALLAIIKACTSLPNKRETIFWETFNQNLTSRNNANGMADIDSLGQTCAGISPGNDVLPRNSSADSAVRTDHSPLPTLPTGPISFSERLCTEVII